MDIGRENGKQTVQTRVETGLIAGLYLFVAAVLQLSAYRNFIRNETYYVGISVLKRLALLLALALMAELVMLWFLRREDFRRKLRYCWNGRSYEQLFLIFVALWFPFTCFLRGRMFGGNYFEANALQMFMAGVMGFLIFPFASFCGRKRTSSLMDWLFITLVVPFAVLLLWLMWHYFRAEYVTLPTGVQLEMEAGAMLHFVGQNHNALAQTALVMLGLSVYLFQVRRALAKPLYALCVVVFSVFLVLTNSRNAWFAALIFLAGCAFLSGWCRFGGRKWIVRLGFSLLCAFLAGLIWHWMKGAVFALLRLSLAWAASGAPTASAAPPAAASAVEARGYEDVAGAGNRLPLYKAAVAAMISSPGRFFFGVTPADVVGTLRETGVAGVSMEYNYVHAHNFFLQMGVSFGVPVMVGTVVFAVSLVIRALRIMFSRYGCRSCTIAVLVCCILANDMLEATLAFRSGLFCVVFYLLAGWLTVMDRDGSDA